MKHTFVNLLALTTLFSINSCNTATEPQPTDATRAEIFHGRPKTLHIATYPAHSNAGEWFKDTTAGQIQHIVNTYNLSGELTSETHAIDDSTTYTIRYEYTAGSPRKTTAVRMHDTTELSRTEYRYDKDDRLIGTETTLANGTPTAKEDYTLNSRGYCKETSYFNGHGVLRMRETCEYNRAGEVTGRDTYHYTGNNRHTIVRYTYQGNGLPASATVQDEQATPKETRTTYTYEYDAQGNWIRRIAYNETLKIATLTERKIEYYQ